MHRMLLLPLGAVLLLSGCAAIDQLQRQMSPAGSIAEEQLLFLDQLNQASGDELTALGERLRPVDGAASQARLPVAALRYALWQATPGHPGFAPSEARQRLEQLVSEEPPRELQALIRVQLRHLAHLQARAALERDNAQLSATHGEQQQEIQALQKKIEALTNLERRMGGGDAGGEP